MFDLASYLPYLVNRVGVRLALAFGRELDRHKIALPMWRVMAALRQRGSERMGRLAAATSIELSTLSRLVAGMERRGLVRRTRAREDARSVVVTLSESGARIAQKLVPKALRYEEMALKGFAQEEAEALKAMLARVYDNLGVLEEGEGRGLQPRR